MELTSDVESLICRVIHSAFLVKKTLGSGFLESDYHKALMLELQHCSIPFESEKRLQVYYRNQIVGDFKADLVVDNKIVVELKAVENISPQHEVQLVNYLAATGMDTGLLINFGSSKIEVKRKFRIYKAPDIRQKDKRTEE